MNKFYHPFLFAEESGAGAAGAGSAGNDAGSAGAGSGQSGSGSEGSDGGAFDIRQHLDDSGSYKPGWTKALGLPDTLEKKFTRPEALAKSYATLEKQIGAKGIIMPGPNATDAERAAFFKALGRPDKPEGYEFKKPDRIGDHEVPDTAWDANRATKWQQKLFELGVPKEQARAIMEAAVSESIEGMQLMEQGMKAAQEKSVADLKKEWGDANFEAKLGAAARAAKQFGGDELANHPALGNDPVLIKALAKIAEAVGEKPGAAQRETGGSTQVSPQDARQQARELTAKIISMSKADRNWAQSAEAQRMKAEKSRLFEIASGAE